MPHIIAIAQQKGGVGKTTTTVSLAAEWLRRGRSVLLVDADPQGPARTWAAVAAEQGQPAPVAIAMDAAQLQRLPELAERFDIALIDTPPRMGTTLRAALVVADRVLLPCGPTALDAWALAETVDLVRQARDHPA